MTLIEIYNGLLAVNVKRIELLKTWGAVDPLMKDNTQELIRVTEVDSDFLRMLIKVENDREKRKNERQKGG